MAPKVKKEKISEEDIQSLCLEYLVGQNRPYSAQDVALNLHERFNKGAALKALQALAERGAIDSKDSGDPPKRSILTFCAKQDCDDLLDSSALLELDREIQSLNEEVSTLQRDNQRLSQDVKMLLLEKSTKELLAREQQLTEEIPLVKSKLENLSNGSRRLYSASEVKKIDDHYILMRSLHRKHMKEFEEVFATMCDGLEKSKSEASKWREELGIDEVEQDEDCRWIDDPLAQAFKRVKS